MFTPSFHRTLTAAELDLLLPWAHSYSDWQRQTWLPLWLNGLRLGRLNETWAQRVQQDWTETLSEDSDGLHLSADGWLALGDSLQNMARRWQELGLLKGWRDERFDVRDGGGGVLFALERAAFRPLGLMSRAIHVNGLTCDGGTWKFWIGRRSPFKAVDPDKLDNLVGGGITAGESVQTAMLRESAEEAGLDENLMRHAQEQCRLLSCRAVSRGLHYEVLHVFDIEIPAGIRPENQDGEVAGFELMDLDTLAAAMCAGKLMDDAQMATLNAMLRFGLIDAAHPLAGWLHGLAWK
ncbi:NUDIX domain-containing protein [Neisseria sp.]|uniref:NUDIX hydrolase n=1 Tax=Neisseria sp. TaxID=192066 RepID=UPI0035A045B3